MKKISHENNFIYLFIALMWLLFSMSALKFLEGTWMSDVMELVILGSLLLGVRSLKADKSWLWSVYAMVFFLGTIFILQKFIHSPKILDTLHLLILLLFFIGSFRLSFRQILTGKEITQNMLVGSVVLYLLIGLIWAILYMLLLIIFPDGFNGLEMIPGRENFSQVTYFSFVTLTTLGYGDISPKNPVTEFFVYMEAISGVFYIAIVVSSLVSARIETLRREEEL